MTTMVVVKFPSDRWAMIFALLLLKIYTTFSGLSCQGANFDAAIVACPDYGAQKFTAGGNVSVVVRRGINLKNLDFSGPSAGISDPFLKFTFGRGYTSKSKVVRNNLNPTWNDQVSLGLLGSGTEILLEVFDFDIGLELNDDLIGAKLFRVPFCSSFAEDYYTEERKTCSTPFGCESSESTWASPLRKVCNETTWVNLDPSRQWNEDADCKRYLCIHTLVHIDKHTITFIHVCTFVGALLCVLR